jgi:hypothetical protein
MSFHVVRMHPAPSVIRVLEGRGAVVLEGEYLRLYPHERWTNLLQV